MGGMLLLLLELGCGYDTPPLGMTSINVYGHVIDADGNPIPNATIEFDATDAEASWTPFEPRQWNFDIETGPSGKYIATIESLSSPGVERLHVRLKGSDYIVSCLVEWIPIPRAYKTELNVYEMSIDLRDQ